MFSNVIIGWAARRALELGGILGAGLTAWNGLPPHVQEAVLLVLGRNWEAVTLGALAPLAFSVWGYVWSFLATKAPQVVTTDGNKVVLDKQSASARQADAVAAGAKPARTLFERLFKR